MLPTVLIVDDHAGYRSAARALLEAEGFEVVGESASGEDALERVESLRPDLVLLDIGLPGIDGIGCEGIFRACGARGFIPKAELSGDTLTALAA